MRDFNEELSASLDALHPQRRTHLNQTLRSGTQTQGLLFGSGQRLVDMIQARINEAVSRYVGGLKTDEGHPFLSRRGRGFRYAGSWSSRLMDCGFHVNHIHPNGWISSCYYVGVPDAVKDEKEKQGWIKFGEPALDVDLKDPIRRAIQPRAGRLVLFPSYMWHGTVPFHWTTPPRSAPMAPASMSALFFRYEASWRRWVPATTASPFFFASSPVAMTARAPTGSTATGFSTKQCLPAATAAAKCTGRKAGGVAMITKAQSVDMTF